MYVKPCHPTLRLCLFRSSSYNAFDEISHISTSAKDCKTVQNAVHITKHLPNLPSTQKYQKRDNGSHT